MKSNKNQGLFLVIGLIGIGMVLVGWDLVTTNYLGKLFSPQEISQDPGEITTDPGIAPDTSSMPAAKTATSDLGIAEDDSLTRATRTPVPPTHTPRPTNTPKPSSTPTPSPSPTIVTAWRACPGIYLSKLQVGDRAYVSYEPPLANRVRRNPSTSAQVLGKIQPGEKVEILDGPECSNSWVWWKVSSLEKNLVGWTSEGDAKDYWLIKIED